MKKNKIFFFVAALICFAFFAVPIKVFSEESLEVVFNDPFSKNQDPAIQDLILTTFEDAEKRIYIAVYNFTDTTCRDALIDAVKRGVEVRLVIYSENADNRIIEDLKKNGIKIVKSQSEGLMHAKFIVVDYETTISGSANLTSGSFFYDNNFMILIHDSKVNKIFQEEFNEMFIEKKFGPTGHPTVPPTSITLKDGTKITVKFSPEDGVEKILLSLIQASQKSIDVLAYSFTSDNLGNALIDRYDDGVDVEVIFEEESSDQYGSEAAYLIRNGIPTYMDGLTDGLMHEKAMIFDESVVAAGSYNFTRAAETVNDEQILIIDNRKIADQFEEEFEKILERAN